MNNEHGQFIKDPQAKLDYGVDWSDWLAGDTISGSSWSAETGITVDASSHTDTVATVWLSGGTVGGSYKVTNHITTLGGREDELTITVSVWQK